MVAVGTEPDRPAGSAVRMLHPRVVRVIVAEGHPLMASALRRVLDAEDAVAVVDETADLERTLEALREWHPDVLLLDLALGAGACIAAIRQLRALAPGTALLAMSMEDEPSFARHVLDAGALGYVVTDRADGELPEAVARLARGERYVSPPLASRLALDRPDAAAVAAGRARVRGSRCC